MVAAARDNARLDLRLWRDGEAFLMRLEDGKVVAPLARVEPEPLLDGNPARTFEITFLASTKVFGTLAYDPTAIASRIEDLGRAHPGVSFSLV